jgi:hypothetical protein
MVQITARTAARLLESDDEDHGEKRSGIERFIPFGRMFLIMSLKAGL